jgi:elongation factor G
MAPALTKLDSSTWTDGRRKAKKGKKIVRSISDEEESKRKVKIGHPLHPTLLALAFKVVHMKGRGGSGDGRVVFARVYSGELHTGDTLQVISPPAPGEAATKPRIERIGGMLELAGGKFDNIEDGMCASGDVCALVGLKSVVTGDTILLEPKGKVKSKRAAPDEPVCLAGVSSPKPVLKVRLEAESAEMQKRLSAALILLAVEDPSLLVEETESATLLSGLGELHIEVTLDRLYREYGLDITVGKPAVAYRESLLAATLETDGLVEYDRTIGASRMQAAIHLRLESKPHEWETSQSACVFLSDPIVTLGQEARAFLKADSDEDEEELMEYNSVVRALILGCKGALKRGPLGSYAMANMSCHIENIDAEGGLPYLESMPGALRAAASHAISGIFAANKQSCSLLEPTMSVEVTVPGSMVGMVLSDLTGRRGHVGDVIFGDGDDVNSKALVRGEVPLVEILGYANSLRSLTGGEGTFTAEYKGHSPCDDPSMMTR